MSTESRNWNFVSLMKATSSALIGIMAAVATVLVLDYVRGSNDESDVHAMERGDVSRKQEKVIRTVVMSRADSTRIDELEKQIQEIGHTEGVNDHDAPARTVADPETIQRELAAEFAELDQQYVDELRDPAWSPEAESNLASGLTTMGEKLGFSVDATECKTTFCRVSLSFGEYESARELGKDLVEATFAGLNCSQKVWMKRPDDPAAPYNAQLYFDCSDQRAGLVEVD
jgi:hypothetical protein